MKGSLKAVILIVLPLIFLCLFSSIKYNRLEDITRAMFHRKIAASCCSVSNIQAVSDYWVRTGRLTYSSGLEREFMSLQDFFSGSLYGYYVSGQPNKVALFLTEFQSDVAKIYLEADRGSEIVLTPDQLALIEDYNLVVHIINALSKPINQEEVQYHIAAEQFDKIERLFLPQYQNKIQWSTTVLFSACADGNSDVVEVLLEKGRTVYNREILAEAAQIARNSNHHELYFFITGFKE